MKKVSCLAIASVFVSVNLYAESFIVKFKSQKSLNANVFLEKSNDQKIHSFRQLETRIGAFAVIDASYSLEQLNKNFSNSSSIQYIERDEIDYRLLNTYQVNDAKYSSQWGLKGSFGIQAESAWSQQLGDRSIVVAVVDTGIDYNHPDLKSNMWVNQAEAQGLAGVDDDGNGVVDDINGINAFRNNGDPQDGNGHGSHCAGVIGAAHNTIGIAGIMKNVQLMAVKIFSDRGRTKTSAIVKGIDYAIENGANVMSNSWGGSRSSQAISDAVKAASDAGIVFVAAAGNGNRSGRGIDIDRSPVYPAAYDFDNIVSVGSITASGERSSFSNFGKQKVDLFAPGSSIISTYKRGKYKSLSGTSMATPHVSGVLGLIYSEFPGIDFVEAKQRLLDGVKNLDTFSDNSVSGGILNAPGALGL
jgi:subtilisin family serine protease